MAPALAGGAADVERGFTALFNGTDLSGWKLVGKKGEGYGVKDGSDLLRQESGGNLFTEKKYGDFVPLRVQAGGGANNGLGIRAPLEGDAAYVGMELQILDDNAAEKKYGQLRPAQFHGSIYDVAPAKRGALKPAGQWNSQEVACQGRNVRSRSTGR